MMIMCGELPGGLQPCKAHHARESAGQAPEERAKILGSRTEETSGLESGNRGRDGLGMAFRRLRGGHLSEQMW